MAEVQRRLETFTVEIEELTQLGFFSEEECSSLVKKQFEFENKINSMNKSLQDFKEYIAYVIALYRIIKIRRNKVKIGDKKHHLEYRVIQRVKNLYEMAATRFPKEMDLFLAFFQFCKEAKVQHATRNMCQMMLKYHRNKEEVWVTAARLFFHEKKDHLQAIKLLQEAIGIHPTSSCLYKECIEYEIISSTKEDISDDDKTKLIAKLEIYFKQAKKNIKHYNFFTNIMTFLLQYSFAVAIQIDLVNYVRESFKDCVNIWKYLATRELEGIHIDMDTEEIECVIIEKGFLNCIAIYEEGLQKISNDNKQELWNVYLQSISDFRYRKDFNKVLNYNRLAINAFEIAASQNYLEENFFLLWLELVTDGKKMELIKYATEKCPNSIDLWALRLRMDIASSKINLNQSNLKTINENIENTFSLGCKNLNNKSLPLWEAMHDYKLMNEANDLKEFYLKAVYADANISCVFKPKYIKWIGEHLNIQEAREAYRNLIKTNPFNQEMYKAMINLELDDSPVNVDNLEFIYKNACEQIGSNCIDVWLEYIKFCMEYKTIKAGKDTITKIVIEATKKLNADLVTDFQERYDDMIQTVKRKKVCRSS